MVLKGKYGSSQHFGYFLDGSRMLSSHETYQIVSTKYQLNEPKSTFDEKKKKIDCGVKKKRIRKKTFEIN